MKRVIGLCGGSGAGKSTVADLLEKQGAECIDADQISREVCAPGAEAYAELLAAFPEYFDSSGNLMRKKLGEFVFSNPEALEKLESITHPAMRNRMQARIDASPCEHVILDCAIVTKPVFRDLADEVWVVTAPEEKRLERIMQRDGISEDQARQRLHAQQENELLQIADRVVENTASAESLLEQIEFV